MSFPEMTWYDYKFNTCFRNPYNNLLELMQMHTVYELKPSDYPSEKEFVKAVENKQLEEQTNIGEQPWIEYIKENKPEVYSNMKNTCRTYRVDIDTVKSFKHYTNELTRRDQAMY